VIKKTLGTALVAIFVASSACAEQIPLERSGGVYTLPVLINNVITLKFVLDSGAAEVSIPTDVALTLYRAGTIDSRDFLEDGVYQQADGSTSKNPRVLIRRLRVGSYEIANVTASIGPISSPLLIGQSLLSRVKSWTIDNRNNLLVLNEHVQQSDMPQTNKSSWISLGVSSEGSYYLDTNSVEVAGELRGFWTNWVKTDGTYYLANYSLRCGSNEAVKVCSTAYTATGSVLGSVCPKRSIVVPPGSFLERTKTTVCNMTTSGNRVTVSRN
jgi:hypothetical protein